MHPKLRYDSTRRQVYLGEVCVGQNGDGSDTLAEAAVDTGVTLIEIPDACLITLNSVESDETFGKRLFEVVHSLIPSEDAQKQNGNNDRGDGDRGGSDGGLYHDAQDVILALYLAHLKEQVDNNDLQQRSASVASTKTTVSPPCLFYRPYLATLPASSPSDTNIDAIDTSSDFQCNLPRQWPASAIQRRLQGMTLYDRVMNEQRGLRREYDMVKNAWREKYHDANDAMSFPTCQSYDAMMAALTSRGFCNLGYDSVDAMIPLLDLLNHVRGNQNVDDEEWGGKRGQTSDTRGTRKCATAMEWT